MLCVFCCLSTVYAKPSCENLNVAFPEGWFPVAFMESESRPQVRGIAIDIVEALAKEYEKTITIVNPVPWKRSILWMDSGKLDMLAGHYWSNERANNWLISDPIFYNEIKVFYRNDLIQEVNSLTDLEKLMGAYPAGASYGSQVDSLLRDKLQTVQLKDNNTILLAVSKGHVDYAVLAEQDGLANVNKLGLQEQMKMSEFSLARLSVHFSFSKRSECSHVFNSFNASLAKYTSEQQINELIKKFSGYYY